MKKTFIIFILILAIVCGSFTGCNNAVPPSGNENPEPESFSATQYSLVENGISNYKIVIPANANDVEKYAADEMQLFLRESTYVDIPIISEAGVSSDKTNCILIGATALRAENQDVESAINDLEYGGVIIKTVGSNVIVTGRTNKGTLNAVYKFLEYEIGFKAYTADYVKYNYFTTLKLLNFDYNYNPSIDQTVITNYEVHGPENIDGASRMYLMGHPNGGTAHDGRLFEMFAHTTEVILPQETYGGLHPDWYGNSQLCFSNEEMIEQFAYALFSGYLSTTNCPYMMIGPADKKSRCTCDKCKEEGALYGGPSGIFARFMNKIAAHVEQYFIDYKIDKEIMLVGLNYYYYESAPVVKNEDGTYSAIHESVIPDNEGKVKVGVCYTPIQACFMHAFNDPNCKTNSGGYKDLLGWSTLTDNMFIYSYGHYHANTGTRTIPYNSWSFIAEQFRLYEEIGLDYLFDESSGSSATPMGDMRIYVRSRLAWNPHVDIEDVMEEFIQNYYGVGAKYFKEYYYAVMDHFEYFYTIDETECQGTFYTQASERKYWPISALHNFQNILMSGINDINENSLLSDAEKQVYTERLRKEWMLMKVNEYRMHSNYCSEEQLLELLEIVKIANEKYGVPL